jgi:hypothetical protein
MKSNLKFDNKNFVAEVSLSNLIEEDEQEIHDTYMNECMIDDAAFVNTGGMSTADAKYMCGMWYMKNRGVMTEAEGKLSEKQKSLPPALQKAILKKQHKAGKLNEDGKKEAEMMGCWDGEMKAEPTAVFPQDPAPPTGNITPKAAVEGLKIDEELKKELKDNEIKNPKLQSAYFEVTEK